MSFDRNDKGFRATLKRLVSGKKALSQDVEETIIPMQPNPLYGKLPDSGNVSPVFPSQNIGLDQYFAQKGGNIYENPSEFEQTHSDLEAQKKNVRGALITALSEQFKHETPTTILDLVNGLFTGDYELMKQENYFFMEDSAQENIEISSYEELIDLIEERFFSKESTLYNELSLRSPSSMSTGSGENLYNLLIEKEEEGEKGKENIDSEDPYNHLSPKSDPQSDSHPYGYNEIITSQPGSEEGEYAEPRTLVEPIDTKKFKIHETTPTLRDPIATQAFPSSKIDR